MTPNEAEALVLATLRKSVFLNTTRQITLDAPLGLDGLGLDSLGLVELLAALEDDLGIELPADAWSTPGVLSARSLARIIATA